MPLSTVHEVLKKTLHFSPYKIQVLQELKQGDFQLRFNTHLHSLILFFLIPMRSSTMHILMNASFFSVEKLKNKIIASTSCGGVSLML
jgi:hypothetical protein